MTKKLLFLFLLLAAAAGTVFGAILLGISIDSKFQSKKAFFARDNKGKPLAFSKHLEKLQKTIPGNGGESPHGPGGGAAEKMFKLAYPDNDIPLARINAARSSFNSIKARTLPHGKGQHNKWISVGPSNASVPFFEFRDATLYTPNKYVAAGRTTIMAISPTCTNRSCRLWIGAAGGGVWRTNKALSGNPNWEYLSGSFEINSIGSMFLDPNDATGNTIWVGTGEANSSADSVFGVGLYKSTNGGNTWQGPIGKSVFNGRAVGGIAVKPGEPNVIYAGSTRAVNGFSSVIGGGVSINIPGAQIWGLYKSTDGGASWTLIHNGAATTAGCTDPVVVATNTTPCSPRGVRNVKIDPEDPAVIYASSYTRGIWRSNDEGATWTQIHTPLNPAATTDRAEIAVTLLESGDTRMYVGHGASGTPYSRLFRSDNVRTGVPVFQDLTSTNVADPGYGSFNYCTGQCWYDNLVYTPPGHPDIVYLGGSYQYNENDPFPPGVGWVSNGRGVVLSQDAGVSWTDLSYDATDFLYPNGLHPDHHAIVTNPSNPLQFFEANDGGVVRSSGELTSIASFCDDRGITGDELARCQQLLSAVPTELKAINKGLSTLQFQSLSVSPFKSDNVQGGTQDNGTWETGGNPVKWTNTMIGDGGQSGFDVGEKKFRFHTFFASQVDANFDSGSVGDWNWISDPFFIAGQGQAGSFYIPIINDPVVSRTLFAGILHVWRTQTYGLGSMTIDEIRLRCNEWTGDFTVVCGDWVQLGDPGPNGQLSSASFGDRAGTFVSVVERSTSDNSTLWAATGTGRVFISKNADANPATSVSFTRIDSTATNDPNRFPTGIFVDPNDPNHAWITYSGFSAATPTEPGHIFSVNFDPGTGTATWTSLDGTLGDIPLSDVAYDEETGDLYVSNDFGVLVDRAGGGNDWVTAAPGLPNVEVAGLTMVADDRKLYAATHGLSAWRLRLR